MSKNLKEKLIATSEFFSSSAFIYIAMLSVGLLVSYFFNENLLDALHVANRESFIELTVLGLLAGSVLTIASVLF